MWIAPVLVLAPIVLRLFGTDHGGYSAGVIVMTFVADAFVGFPEELLTRGVAVTLLRRHGHGEWTVAALSSLVVSLLHGVDLLSGQGPATVAVTKVYTFAFSVLMHLTLRASGKPGPAHAPARADRSHHDVRRRRDRRGQFRNAGNRCPEVLRS